MRFWRHAAGMSLGSWPLIVLAAGTVGCAGDDPTVGSQAAMCQDLPEPWSHPGDPMLDRMAAEVPGFAGYQRLPGDAAQVNLTDPGIGPQYETALREELSAVSWWSGEITFQGVAFSYLELWEWESFFADVPGLNGLSVDTGSGNYVEVSVDDEAAQAEAARVRDCRSVPPSAVVIFLGQSGED